MTITQAAWYKKTCKTIIYSAVSLSFLIFPLFKQRHVGEPTLSSASAHCQDSFSHKYLAAVVLFQLEQTRNGLGQSEELDCRGGSCQSGKKESKHLFRGQTRRARSAAETQPCAAAMQLHPNSAQHRESHNLHARVGPEDLGQLEEGV